MKQRKVKEEKLEFYDNCPICNLEIAGSTESQVNYNMKNHVEKCRKRK